MAERVSFIPESSSDNPEDGKEKKAKKKSKKASLHLGASVIGTEKKVEATDAKAETKTEGWDKLLADLALEKAPKEQEKAKTEAVLDRGKDKDKEKDTKNEQADAAEIPELQLSHELREEQLSGGEFIINLREPVQESVDIPLEAEDHDTEHPAEPPKTPSWEIPNLPIDDTPEETPPPLNPAGASGGSGGIVPPPPRPTPSSPFPRRRPGANPGFTAGANTVTAPPAATNFNQLIANKQATEEAWHLGRRRGHGEGLLAGLIAGGSIEHFRHKSREKKMEKKAKEERRKHETAAESAWFHRDRLEKEQSATAKKLETDRRSHEENLVLVQQSEAAATTRALAAEKERADTEKAKAELIERLNAQAAEQERHAAEELLKNPENRIETSAWHAIEVDKSGHAVQDTAIEYGHEYYHERAQEAAPKEDVDVKAGGTALAAVVQAGSGAPASSEVNTSQPRDIYRETPAATPQHLQAVADISSAPTPHTQATSLVPWLILLVLIVVLIVFLG